MAPQRLLTISTQAIIPLYGYGRQNAKACWEIWKIFLWWLSHELSHRLSQEKEATMRWPTMAISSD